LKTFARLGAAAGALTLVFVGMAPAQAARYTHIDPSSDVALQTCNNAPTCDDITTTVDATRTEGDIKSLSTNHGLDNVVIKASFAALTKNSQTRFFGARIVTNEGYSRLAVVYFDADVPGGIAMLMNNAGDQVKCTVTKSIDFTANTIQVSVPRSCLSMPYWVRGGAQYLRMIDDTHQYADDAFTTGTVPDLPALGQQMKRG
jgi:hypothetical protein